MNAPYPVTRPPEPKALPRTWLLVRVEFIDGPLAGQEKHLSATEHRAVPSTYIPTNSGAPTAHKGLYRNIPGSTTMVWKPK